MRLLIPVLVTLLLPATLCCQENGFIFSERYWGSYQAEGQVHRLDTSVGYRLNNHVAVTTGVPFYFVRTSSTLASSGQTSANGIGNVYLNLILDADLKAAGYRSVIMVTAPTGDKTKGFSTGRVTFDWTNSLSKTVGRLTPFVDIGIANAVSDTPFWVRPFDTVGFNVHADGGTTVRLWGPVTIGASVYTVLPAGEQKVYSRIVPGQANSSQPASPGSSQGRGRGMGSVMHQRGFETSSVTTGGSDLVRDHGYSGWLGIAMSRYAGFIAGYTRSATYALNIISAGISINIGSLIGTNRW